MMYDNLELFIFCFVYVYTSCFIYVILFAKPFAFHYPITHDPHMLFYGFHFVVITIVPLPPLIPIFLIYLINNQIVPNI